MMAPAWSGRSGSAPELLLAEYQARRLSGAPCELNDFGGRFPRQIGRLKQLLKQSSAAASVGVSRAARAETSQDGKAVETKVEQAAKSLSDNPKGDLRSIENAAHEEAGNAAAHEHTGESAAE